MQSRPSIPNKRETNNSETRRESNHTYILAPYTPQSPHNTDICSYLFSSNITKTTRWIPAPPFPSPKYTPMLQFPSHQGWLSHRLPVINNAQPTVLATYRNNLPLPQYHRIIKNKDLRRSQFFLQSLSDLRIGSFDNKIVHPERKLRIQISRRKK